MGRDDDDEGFDVGRVECLRDTGQAILLRMLEDAPVMKEGKEFWVPQSQVHDNSEVCAQGDVGELIVTNWFAEQKEWAD